MTITIRAICVGLPQTRTDARGTWRSGIFKQPVDGPVELGPRSLAGDGVADRRHHGSPDQAVCCLPGVHHAYWGERYGRSLLPGAFGENWMLDGADEREFCIGDIYEAGTAQVQVSQPRIPCSAQERNLDLPGLQQAIMDTLRTGFYLRVLVPGTVTAGAALRLLARPCPDLTIQQVNEYLHRGTDDAALVARLAALPELSQAWKGYFRKRVPET